MKKDRLAYFHGTTEAHGQRDERLGWMGDADLTADSFAINFDYAAFQDAFLRNMVDAQVSTV